MKVSFIPAKTVTKVVQIEEEKIVFELSKNQAAALGLAIGVVSDADFERVHSEYNGVHFTCDELQVSREQFFSELYETLLESMPK